MFMRRAGQSGSRMARQDLGHRDIGRINFLEKLAGRPTVSFFMPFEGKPSGAGH